MGQLTIIKNYFSTSIARFVVFSCEDLILISTHMGGGFLCLSSVHQPIYIHKFICVCSNTQKRPSFNIICLEEKD